MSHAIEDLVLTRDLPAMFFTGFQESSHWREETERYRAIASVAQQVCIFAGGKLPEETHASQVHVQLLGDDPLRQEWFLALLSKDVSVVLCGQDKQAVCEDEANRQFATIWSFNPDLIARVLDLLETVLEQYRPDRVEEVRKARLDFPPAAPDPTLITSLTSEMIRYQENLNQQLHQSNQTLKRQLSWRETMMATVVHDMRGPLSAISGYLQLFSLEDTEPEERQEFIAETQSGVERLVLLVEDILDTNRLDEGEFTLELTLLNLAAWSRRVADAWKNRFQAAKTELLWTLHPKAAFVWADEGLLTRVLDNLIGNALKFTPTGGKVQVLIQPAPQPGRLEIRVVDTGQGISTQDLPSIFDRYTQVRPDSRGLGLGLYFARLALQAMNGQVAVTSAIGSGTAFTLSLPSKPPSALP